MTVRELATELTTCGPDEAYRRLILWLLESQQSFDDRHAQRLSANASGYFWTPCLLCGEWHGGQEPHAFINMDEGRGYAVCINCKPEALALNEQYPHGLKLP